LSTKSLAEKNAISLKQSSGFRVDVARFQRDEIETQSRQKREVLLNQSLSFVQGDKRHLQLYSRNTIHRCRGRPQNSTLEPLDVQLYEGASALAAVFSQGRTESSNRHFLNADVCRLRSARQVRGEHLEERAAERVPGDVHDGLAIVITDCATYDVPGRVVLSHSLKLEICPDNGLEGDDATTIADGAKVSSVLTDVGSDVENEVDLRVRQNLCSSRERMIPWRVSNDIEIQSAKPRAQPVWNSQRSPRFLVRRFFRRATFSIMRLKRVANSEGSK
jgi:hypothetical protein